MNLRQHLEEQQKEDFELLKEYEEMQRCATDPRERRKCRNAIKEIKQQISEREAEIKNLQGQTVQHSQEVNQNFAKITALSIFNSGNFTPSTTNPPPETPPRCSDLKTEPVLLQHPAKAPQSSHQSLRNKNYALFFDGVNDYIEVTSPEVVNQIGRGDFTFSTWVCALEREQVRHPQILSNRSADGAGFLFGFHCRWRGSKNKIPYVQLDNLNWVEYPNQPDLLNGQWHHFVARRQGNNLTYFADGELVASLNISRIKNHNIASEQPLLIGWDLVNPSQTHFKGKIEKLSIWNRALSETEIQSDLLDSLQGNEPGLLSYWSFDEGSGNLAHDKSGHGNHGKIFGASWTAGRSI